MSNRSVQAQASPARSSGEKRRFPRTRMLKAGKVILSEQSTIDCTIRDFSPGGARLVFAAPTPLPKLFRLLIVATDNMVPATLVWQKGLAAGVSFELPKDLGPR
jgi:hypothetical protein